MPADTVGPSEEDMMPRAASRTTGRPTPQAGAEVATVASAGRRHGDSPVSKGSGATSANQGAGGASADAAPSNLVVLRGHLSSDAQCRQLESGSTLWTLEVTTRGIAGAASVPVAVFDPSTEPDFAAGDEVYVVGEVRRRFFRAGGATQSRTEVVAIEVVRGSQRAKVRASLARLAAAMGAPDTRGLPSG